MKVEHRPGDKMVLTLTTGQLSIIEYALAEGVERFQSKAHLMEVMKDPRWKSAAAIAKKALSAQEALRKATNKWILTGEGQ